MLDEEVEMGSYAGVRRLEVSKNGVDIRPNTKIDQVQETTDIVTYRNVPRRSSWYKTREC